MAPTIRIVKKRTKIFKFVCDYSDADSLLTANLHTTGATSPIAMLA